ncbi:hypothetical protein Bhyg_07697 [Pseudolycoriella hygida]|uniref:Uncharacterized protein n=1 Tax=Pseudolycoriella hygida TaxID=35572 RepID=A0A9Q0N361_9DIPT|nr:hypothetical protein Bhyg_07697 [Pseudolycoriella hygida]
MLPVYLIRLLKETLSDKLGSNPSSTPQGQHRKWKRDNFSSAYQSMYPREQTRGVPGPRTEEPATQLNSNAPTTTLNFPFLKTNNETCHDQIVMSAENTSLGEILVSDESYYSEDTSSDDTTHHSKVNAKFQMEVGKGAEGYSDISLYRLYHPDINKVDVVNYFKELEWASKKSKLLNVSFVRELDRQIK